MVDHTEETSARRGLASTLGTGVADRPPLVPRKRSGIVLCALSLCTVIGGLALLAVVAGGLFVAGIAQGPITFDALGPRIAGALDDRFGHGYEFFLGPITITRHGYAPALSIDGLSVKEKSGQTLVSAPRAEVSLDPFFLMFGRVMPKRLEIFDVELRLSLNPEGSLAVSSGHDSKEMVTLAPPLAVLLAAPQSTGTPQPGAKAQADAAGTITNGLVANDPTRVKPRALIVKQMAAAIRLAIDTLTNPDSPIAAIDRIGITRGRLVVDDKTTDQTMVFDDVKLAFDKRTGATTFTLAALGPNGRWSATGLASGAPGQQRRLELSIEDLSRDEIALALGQRDLGADFDTPISTRLSFGLGGDGALSEASGHFRFGAGFFRTDDPDFEPILLDQFEGGFHWEPATRRIKLDEMRFLAGATHFAITGAVIPPTREGDAWKIGLSSPAPNIFGPERPGEKPITIDHLDLAAQLFLNEKQLVIDRFSFSSPQGGGFAMAGNVDWTNGPHLRLGASINPTQVRTAVRLWPSFIAAPVRTWFLAHVTDGMIQKGTLRLDVDAAALKAMRAELPPPDEAVLLDLTITNGSVDFLPGVPPLHDIEGTGHATGWTSNFAVTNGILDTGNGHRLLVTEGSFHIPDGRIKPTQATLIAKVSGSVEAVGDLLARDALKPYASLPIDPSTVRGQIDGTLQVDMKLGPRVGPGDTAYRISALATNFAADKLIGKEGLDSATLAINVDPGIMKVSGKGLMFGSPATLEVVSPAGKPADASFNLSFDDAARARMGFMLPWLTGTVGTRLTTEFGTSDKPKTQVELDLTHAAFDNLLPGISKPAGRPAKAVFSVNLNDNGTALDPFILDAGSMQAKGAVELGADQSLSAARFAQVKLSPGDDMKVDILKLGEMIKVIVKGTAIDARPFLKSLIYTQSEANPGIGNSAPSNQVPGNNLGITGQTGAGDLDIDLSSPVLTGFNKQVLTGAELRLVKHGEQLKQFSFTGRFGREPVAGNLTGAPAAPQLNLSTEDAGSLLSFIDLYKHMEGGRLSAALRLGGESTAGHLIIDNFLLHDEPSLRRLVAEGVPPEAEANGKVQKIDPGAVPFRKLQVHFQRAGSRLDLEDGTMYGNQIGLTVDGWLDYVHDRVDMKGTFVPAFAVNNLFSKIPLFGVLLGGGTNEGLFAVNYRISGQASAPTLSVNPLSAIAPGILRQIFGVDGALPPGAQQ